MNPHESSSIAEHSVKAGEVCVSRKDSVKLFHEKFTSEKLGISATQIIVFQSNILYKN